MLTCAWQEPHCNESSQKAERETWYVCQDIQTDLSTQRERGEKTWPLSNQFLNTSLILVLAFRPNVPMALGFNQIGKMLINSAQVERLCRFPFRSDHLQSIWLMSQLWWWFRAPVLQEPWLMHKPWRNYFKVVKSYSKFIQTEVG